MIKIQSNIRYLLFLLLAMATACSSEKTNLVSIAYHNTTARYNAYFYAKQGIKTIESGIKQSHQSNFDHILRIFPPLDSSQANTYQETIQDVIKKASLAIQNHQNSKWVDDSYNLIGLARLYGHEHESAIETFKYVNTNSKDDDARHKALINLMRTFIEYGEMNNALAVSDFLKKEKLNKKNLKKLYLTRAYFYQKRNDLDNMVSNLDQVAATLNRKEGKARIYFIMGQIYQELGFESEAYSNYKKCLASNPPYELSFYSKLNMAQVTELKRGSDVKRIEKYFKKLLSDAKNTEFRDKIYFEMAEFEMKQDKMDQAIEYYKESIRASFGNNRQKGLSYLKLGIINYDSLKNYELAQAYYDSTVLVMPKDYEKYDEIVRRQEVLDDFVLQLNTIKLQDSLLLLSNRDSLTVAKTFEERITEQKEKELEEARQQKKKRSSTRNRTSSFDSFNMGIRTSSLNWYFNNPSAISLGQVEFKRIWSDRPLEDNWRRSNKSGALTLQLAQDEQNVNSENIIEQGINVTAIKAEVKSIMQMVPYTSGAKENALKQIEDAYYALGNIYHFNLQEPENAIKSFNNLITRFPGSQYEPEVLYLLYLIYLERESPLADQYKKRLLENYYNTSYAKLIINPNYKEESSKELGIIKEIYNTAYDLYQKEYYDSTRQIVRTALNTYSDNQFLAKLKLLDILVTAKTEDFHKYKFELTQFLEKYPDNEVTAYARQLLNAVDTWEQKLVKIRGDEFLSSFTQSHYFVLIFNHKQYDIKQITQTVESFNIEHFEEMELTAGHLLFDKDRSLILVSGLDDRSKAIQYYDYFLAENGFIDETNQSIFTTFVITKDNFDIFYRSKDLEKYYSFFEQHY